MLYHSCMPCLWEGIFTTQLFLPSHSVFKWENHGIVCVKKIISRLPVCINALMHKTGWDINMLFFPLHTWSPSRWKTFQAGMQPSLNTQAMGRTKGRTMNSIKWSISLESCCSQIRKAAEVTIFILEDAWEPYSVPFQILPEDYETADGCVVFNSPGTGTRVACGRAGLGSFLFPVFWSKK